MIIGKPFFSLCGCKHTHEDEVRSATLCVVLSGWDSHVEQLNLFQRLYSLLFCAKKVFGTKVYQKHISVEVL